MTAVPAERDETVVVAPRRPARRGAGTDAPAAGPVGRAGAHRTDIQGMRAVAVLLVVLSHAGVAGLAGGYVGVDVFFVISGFLITSLLLREVEATGTVALGRFYARRAVRLLPASTLVLVATLAGSWWWLSPVRVAEHARDALAAAAYVINVRLAVAGTDYFADTVPSPLQHYWSLAVEEQFYLLWPVLIVLTCLACRRRPAGQRRVVLIGMLATVTAVSFLLSVLATQRGTPWAYFGLHSRGWQLGVGALVAVAAGRLARMPRRAVLPLGAAGLAAVLIPAIGYDGDTRFPGLAALPPVAGAALLIAAGCADPAAGAGRLLRIAPLQSVGRLSYSWYLWHWPVLLIAPAALHTPAGVGVNLVFSAGALLLAVLTYHLVEEPVRRRRTLVARPTRGVALGLALSVAAAAPALLAAALPPTLPVGHRGVDTRAAVLRAAEPAAALSRLIADAESATALPSNLTPGLYAAAKDLYRPQRDGCHRTLTASPSVPSCVYGPADAATTVVLFGDSHALQWFPAMDALAVSRGWRLVSLTRSACPPAGIAVDVGKPRHAYGACAAWRTAALLRIRDLAPQLVVAASSTNYRGVLRGDPADPDAVWRAGWARTLSALRGHAERVVVLGDTPFLAAEPVDCLAAAATAMHECAAPTAQVLRDAGWRAILTREAERTGALLVDPVPWMCARTCPLVIGNVLVYRDSNHLSNAYASLLAPLLDAALPTG